mgnify:CR=1 FL=1|tara:strand:- start:252 stop:977 length:726 start_codon:yes stop_codon:yes gene_type:complete
MLFYLDLMYKVIMDQEKKSYFMSADNFSMPYYEYVPKNKTKSAIVLVYEIFGVTLHMHKFARMLASKGYLVYMPEIFSRLEKNVSLKYNKQGFEKGLSLKKELGWDYPVMDIVALASLIKQKYQVTCLGFCFGGSIAWRASQKSFLFDNAVCYYGTSIPDFLDKKINNPIMVHFGQLDSGIPEEKINAVKSFAIDQNNELIIHVYENADHGFNCEDRKSFHKSASSLSIERSLEFVDKSHA